VSRRTKVPEVPEVPEVLRVQPRTGTVGTLGTRGTLGTLRTVVGGFVFTLLLTAGAPYAFAQQPPDGLNDQQRLGRQVFAQSCGVCHLPPARGARTYGPVLGKTSGGGNDDLVRKVILEGTPRMPGFKYMLQPAQIDAIVAYIRAVPAPALPAAPPAPR
jgi:mono/diheme cytochrome c family protein